MYFIKLMIDDEPYEVELSLGDIYSKCIKCGTVYRQHFSTEELQYAGPPTEGDLMNKNCCRVCYEAYLGTTKKARSAQIAARVIRKLTGVTLSEDDVIPWLQENVNN